MNFPIEILPRPNYKYIDCDLSNPALARFINIINIDEIIDPATGYVKQAYICSPREHCSDLSTNLLGIFQVQS
jgi:hypothetical protein